MFFEQINSKIQKFISDQNINSYEIKDNDYKLSLSDAIFCTEDKKRNRLFFEAIKKAIWNKKNQKVIDAGSWTWILWIFALLLWAESCVFIENNPYTLEFSKKLIKYLKLKKKAIFVLSDAIYTKLDEKYDILISETLISSLHKEDFGFIVNNLKKHLTKDWIIIPEELELNVKEFYKKQEIDHFFKFDSYMWFDEKKLKIKKESNKNIEFNINIKLYDNVYIKTWDCPLFINKVDFNRKVENHPFIDFIES